MKSTVAKLKDTLKQIGLSKFKEDDNLKDFTYNGRDIANLKQDYYLILNNSFKEYFAILLAEKKVDKELIGLLYGLTATFHNEIKKNKNQLRVNYLLAKSKNRLRESHEWTHNVINSTMNAQQTTLKNIHSFLNNLYKDIDYLTNEDINNLTIRAKRGSTSSQLINHPEIGKVVINLTKKDSIALILILEHFGYLDFSNTDKNHFIEKNFNYKQNKEMNAINSEISNLFDKDKMMAARNKTSTKKLVNNLKDLLEDFDFERFLNSRKY